jgi:effector-binding domain-containing protein
MTISAIELRDQPEQHTAVVRHRISMKETSRVPQFMGETFEAVQRAGQQPAGMPFLRTLSMDADGMDIEVGWPVRTPFAGKGDVHAGTLPGGPVATASYLGPYDGIGPAYAAIQAWCTEQGHEIAGPPWESYITDPNQEPDPTKWQTDIYFPIRG